MKYIYHNNFEYAQKEPQDQFDTSDFIWGDTSYPVGSKFDVIGNPEKDRTCLKFGFPLIYSGSIDQELFFEIELPVERQLVLFSEAQSPTTYLVINYVNNKTLYMSSSKISGWDIRY